MFCENINRCQIGKLPSCCLVTSMSNKTDFKIKFNASIYEYKLKGFRQKGCILLFLVFVFLFTH